jgi:vancomycin resistance protein YoaR
MTTDPIEPKEQSKASVRPAPVRTPAREMSKSKPAELADDAAASSKPQRRFAAHFGRPRITANVAPDFRLVGFVAAFAIGTFATLFVFMALAFGYAGSYDNRILPGVHVGSVDLSGLSRDQAVGTLSGNYAYVAEGEVTVTTPVGVTTITYQQLGRRPDAEAMADAAMSVGHSGNPLADAASVLHAAAFGQEVPVVIQVDPGALAERIHKLVGASNIPAQDAQATGKDGNFAVRASTQGYGVDEVAIGTMVIDKLSRADAPADLQAGGKFVSLKPHVSDDSARAAIAQAQKMFVDVSLTWSKLPVNAPAATSWHPQTWTVTNAQIKSWIIFGQRQDGTYAPAVDPAQVSAYLAGISSKVSIPPVEPAVIWDLDGKPKDLTPGKDGVGIDLGATTAALSAYLDQLAAGTRPDATLEIVTGPIHPQIANVDSIKGMEVIGAWTTVFFPGPSNGDGKNIRQPALNLNGKVIGPGQQFSFLTAVGPIDLAHGFGMGGAIIRGKSDHTGAMGGGICSASTTVFNAAVTAGLEVNERHAHFYFINRYPVGRDSTVFSDGQNTWDSRWTNDTHYPIVIRAWATYGGQSSITVQIWSMKVERTTTWTGGVKAGIVKASEGPVQYVKTLQPGQTYRAEYPDDGFDTWVRRVVTDPTGAVIHDDTWQSHYSPVTGVLQMGGSPAPSQTPTPSGGIPTPTPGAPTPSPTPNSSTRRREDDTVE